MRTDLRAELDDALERYRSLTAGLARMSGELAGLRATARATDGSVTVSVDAHGQLIALSIDPRLGPELDPRALAARVLEASACACAEARERTQAAVVDLLPERLRSAVAADGTLDPAGLLPDPDAVELPGGRR